MTAMKDMALWLGIGFIVIGLSMGTYALVCLITFIINRSKQ